MSLLCDGRKLGATPTRHRSPQRFWRGTETGLLGLLTTDDQVFACDGSLADSALGGGAFCLATGQSRYAKLVEGQDTDSSARAEILAAIIALNWCLDPSLDIGTPKWIYDCTPKARSGMGTRRVVILTDCQVLLDTVEQWTDEGPRPSLRHRPNGDLLDVLFRKLHAATASDILTVFVKVKAHRGDPANELADAAADRVAFNHGLKQVLILEFTRAYDKQEDWADTTETYKTSRYIPLLQLLRTILGPLGWEIAQANFTVGVWGSIPESRFDKSLTALGVPRSKFNSIHAKCSRAALDMHEFMLQCYYQIRGRSAEKLQVDKAMLTSTPLGGIARLSPCHVISR